MKELFYLAMVDFENWESDGICKKILNQIHALRSMHYNVDFCYIKKGVTYVQRDQEEKRIGKAKGIIIRKRVCEDVKNFMKNKKYEGIYIRYCFSDRYFINLLKFLKDNKVKIVVEIPTYPYDAEFQDKWDKKLVLFLDKYYRKIMKEYVDRIVTYSKDKMIFGIPTLNCVNGIDFSQVSVRNNLQQATSINLIAVASMVKWQGYDRLIKGIGEYYRTNGRRNLKLFLVGCGPEINYYKEISSKYKIDKHIFFCGMKFGEELDAIYNICDLAVAPLGMHRKDVYISSALKTREYVAKGLPIITSTRIDVFPEDKCYFVCRVPEDESLIDIRTIIKYYDEIYLKKDKSDVIKEIRDYGKQVCDMIVVMKDIVNYFDSEETEL